MSEHITTVDWDKGPVAKCMCGWLRRVSSHGVASGYTEANRLATEHEDRVRAFTSAAVPGAGTTEGAQP